MLANRTLLQHKYASVIDTLSRRQNIGLRQAMDMFYKSQTYKDMRDGISDMHCRSDEYLAEEVDLEQ
jgi:hypothetical protein